MNDVSDSRNGVWVVVAAYNEGRVVTEVLGPLVRDGYAVVLVDDGSCDDTAARARAAGATIVRHAINRGQGAALQSGVRYALDRGARILVTFDADGQHSAEDVPRLVAPILDGRADVVLGSRFLGNGAPGVPPARRLLLRMAVAFTAMVSGMKLTDTHNGMRALSRRAAEQLDLRLDRMAHASEIVDQIARTRLPVMEVPVDIRYTTYSLSKGQRATAAARIAWEYLFGKLSG